MTDVIKSTLPPKENHELAEELLSRIPGLDRAELLKDMVALCFFWMRHGNKREEKQACDFLNELQRIAIRNASTCDECGGPMSVAHTDERNAEHYCAKCAKQPNAELSDAKGNREQP